jgi:hypothetical protein
MGDVQFILGGAAQAAASDGDSGPFRRRAAAVAPVEGFGQKKKQAKPSRELQGLLSSTPAVEEVAVPAVPSIPMALGQVFKAKRGAAQGARW